MKKLIATGLAVAGLAMGSAQAGSTSGTFNVDVTLTAACTLSAINAVAFDYTSLQAGAANATGGGFSVTCTNSLPYTFGLQAGNGGAPGFATINVTDDAVNLSYQLGLSAAGGAGNGAAQAYSVTGTMAGGQAGTCVSGSCTNGLATNKTHTLIINY